MNGGPKEGGGDSRLTTYSGNRLNIDFILISQLFRPQPPPPQNNFGPQPMLAAIVYS